MIFRRENLQDNIQSHVRFANMSWCPPLRDCSGTAQGLLLIEFAWRFLLVHTLVEDLLGEGLRLVQGDFAESGGRDSFSRTHGLPCRKQNSKPTSFLSLLAVFIWFPRPDQREERREMKRAPSGSLIRPEAMAVKFNQTLLLDQAAVNCTNKYGHPPHADNVQFDSAARQKAASTFHVV